MKKISGLSRSLGIHKTNKNCPIHKVPLQAMGCYVACPICTAQEINQEKQALIRKQQRDSTQGMLFSESLPADKEEFVRATFKSFDAARGVIQAQCWAKARNIAAQYLQYHGKWSFSDEKENSRHIVGALKDRSDGFNTVLSGRPGSGKTHLATSIVKAVNDHSADKRFAGFYQKCLFISIVALIKNIRKSWQDTTARWTLDYAEKQMKAADLLVIDDLGSESTMQARNPNGREAKQWVQESLLSVLEAQHRVIITTNLTVDELHQTYNSKLVSRMLAGSQGHIIDFKGVDDNRKARPHEANPSLF